MTSEPLGWGQLLRGEPGRGFELQLGWGPGGTRPCLCRCLHSPHSHLGSDSHGHLSQGPGGQGEPTGC